MNPPLPFEEAFRCGDRAIQQATAGDESIYLEVVQCNSEAAVIEICRSSSDRCFERKITREYYLRISGSPLFEHLAGRLLDVRPVSYRLPNGTSTSALEVYFSWSGETPMDGPYEMHEKWTLGGGSPWLAQTLSVESWELGEFSHRQTHLLKFVRGAAYSRR